MNFHHPDDRINVLLCEDDPYAIGMMGMLLARDWRTRVVCEFTGNITEFGLSKFLKDSETPSVHAVIIDSEVPMDVERPIRLATLFSTFAPDAVIIFTATFPNERFLKRISSLKNFGGYIAKKQIMYSLAEAVIVATRYQVVVTPDVAEMGGECLDMKRVQVLSGGDPMEDFNQNEKNVARLGILFNMTQQDISDEMDIDDVYVGNIVSKVYNRLDIRGKFFDSQVLEDFFDSPVILRKIEQIKASSGRKLTLTSKIPCMSTIAFHVLTRPAQEYD